MSQATPLTACHECDLLLREIDLSSVKEGSVACPRCSAELYRVGRNSLERSLALTCAALVLLVLANTFPIVSLNIQGHTIETTVFGAARQLWRNDMPGVAVLLLATTVLIPLVELCALGWLLFPLYLGYRPTAFSRVFRALQLAHPWAMVEIFILGVLVSLVKLSHLADVLPGPAIWCFGALMLVLSALSAIVDYRELWQAWEAAEA